MVTVYDVARMAGVSSATVSRAVNTPDAVSPDTLARINKAIAKLGYAPTSWPGASRPRPAIRSA